jgi:hypothetical protein
MNFILKAAILTATCVSLALPASAGQELVATGPGGNVIEYARMASNARLRNTNVRFTGQCASACTLFLSVPSTRSCITRGTSFVFHSARGSNRAFNNWGTEYLMTQYPSWVQSWINANGGLDRRLLHMDYRYAAQFIPTCNTSITSRAKS